MGQQALTRTPDRHQHCTTIGRAELNKCSASACSACSRHRTLVHICHGAANLLVGHPPHLSIVRVEPQQAACSSSVRSLLDAVPVSGPYAHLCASENIVGLQDEQPTYAAMPTAGPEHRIKDFWLKGRRPKLPPTAAAALLPCLRSSGMRA